MPLRSERGCLMILAAISMVACSKDATRDPALLPEHQAASVAVARVSSARGDVRIRHGSTGSWVAVTPETEIIAGDLIQALGSGSASLRVAATGAEIEVQANTTMRFDDTARPRAMTGRIVARVGTPGKMRVEIALPPGVLVLAADPASASPLEAAVDIAENGGATVEMRAGIGQLVPKTGGPVMIAEHQITHFGRDGQVVAPAAPQPTITLLEPADGARVRVRRDLPLKWAQLSGVDGYRVELVAGSVARRIDVTESTASPAVASGRYTWSVSALHRGEPGAASAVRTFEVEVDDRPPGVAVSRPAPGESVVGPRIRIEGRADPGALIEVQGVSTTASRDGAFMLEVAIEHGLTNLVISARDDLGNARRVTQSVLWE